MKKCLSTWTFLSLFLRPNGPQAGDRARGMQFVPVQRDDGRQGRGGELQQLLEFVPGDKVKVVSFMARISSVSSLVTFVLGPWIGELSDTLGRKPVLVGTQMIMAVCWYWRNALQVSVDRCGDPIRAHSKVGKRLVLQFFHVESCCNPVGRVQGQQACFGPKLHRSQYGHGVPFRTFGPHPICGEKHSLCL